MAKEEPGFAARAESVEDPTITRGGEAQERTYAGVSLAAGPSWPRLVPFLPGWWLQLSAEFHHP